MHQRSLSAALAPARSACSPSGYIGRAVALAAHQDGYTVYSGRAEPQPGARELGLDGEGARRGGRLGVASSASRRHHDGRTTCGCVNLELDERPDELNGPDKLDAGSDEVKGELFIIYYTTMFLLHNGFQ